jgi:hypothetical protein
MEETAIPDNRASNPHPSNKNSRGRSVTIVLPIEPDLSNDATRPWKLTSGLCKMVQETAKSNVARLQLFVKKRQLVQNHDKRAKYGPQEQKFISLEEIMRGRSPMVLGRPQHRYLLAFALAHGFMQTCGEPWSPVIWSKAQICFRCHESQPVLDISKPYLSTDWKPLRKLQRPKASKNAEHKNWRRSIVFTRIQTFSR